MRRIGRVLAGLAIFCAAACSLGTVLEPTADPSKFFVLTPVDSAMHGIPITYSSGGVTRPLEIGLGPIKFPAYLQRPEMVTRSSPTQVELSPVNRWAEPLDKDFVSVLAQDLMVQIGAHIVTFPWYRPTNLDYQVTVDITQFDTDTKGNAVLNGRWEIKDPNTGELLKSGEIRQSESALAGETRAATLSRALGVVSTQLADAIRNTKHPPPAPKMS